MSTTDFNINDGAYQRLMAELRGERLLWSGRPAQGLRLRRTDRIMIPFTIVFLGFAVFMEIMAIHNDGDDGVLWPLVIFGALFVLIGIYLTIGRFFHDAHARQGTIYGITDQRALLVTGGGRKLRSLKLSAIPEITMTERADGSGDVMLGSGEVSTDWDSSTETWQDSRTRPPTLEMIANVREVYDLALRVQAGKS